MAESEIRQAAKKVAKKAAKKVAKKAAKKAAGKHGPGQDVRRAYEHLHRVGILHGQLGREAVAQIETLSKRAQRALGEGDGRSAADLLRAAEHLAFGSLGRTTANDAMGEALAQAGGREYNDLRSRAEERRREHKPAREVDAILGAMLREAEAAYGRGALHRALEFARGAEALTHVGDEGPGRLTEGNETAIRRR